MKSRRSKFILSMLAVLILSSPVLPQTRQSSKTESRMGYWINFGFGRSTLGWLAGSANLTVSIDRLALSLRGTTNSEGLFLDDFWDVAALVGWGKQHGRRYIAFGLGLAVVGGYRSAGLFSANRPVPLTPGFAVESQWFIRARRWLGAGLYTYLNLNGEETFGGITLCVQVGKY